jgi:ribonuclease HI
MVPAISATIVSEMLLLLVEMMRNALRNPTDPLYTPQPAVDILLNLRFSKGSFSDKLLQYLGKPDWRAVAAMIAEAGATKEGWKVLTELIAEKYNDEHERVIEEARKARDMRHLQQEIRSKTLEAIDELEDVQRKEELLVEVKSQMPIDKRIKRLHEISGRPTTSFKLRLDRIIKPHRIEHFDGKSARTVSIYGDGSFVPATGDKKCIAGFGSFYGFGDKRNKAVRLVQRQLSINKAELTFILDAFVSHPYENLVLYVDSQCSLDSVKSINTLLGDRWKPRNQQMELEAIRPLLQLRNQRNLTHSIVKVKAHTGIIGNEAADTLARSAVFGFDPALELDKLAEQEARKAGNKSAAVKTKTRKNSWGFAALGEADTAQAAVYNALAIALPMALQIGVNIEVPHDSPLLAHSLRMWTPADESGNYPDTRQLTTLLHVEDQNRPLELLQRVISVEPWLGSLVRGTWHRIVEETKETFIDELWTMYHIPLPVKAHQSVQQLLEWWCSTKHTTRNRRQCPVSHFDPEHKPAMLIVHLQRENQHNRLDQTMVSVNNTLILPMDGDNHYLLMATIDIYGTGTSATYSARTRDVLHDGWVHHCGREIPRKGHDPSDTPSGTALLALYVKTPKLAKPSTDDLLAAVDAAKKRPVTLANPVATLPTTLTNSVTTRQTEQQSAERTLTARHRKRPREDEQDDEVEEVGATPPARPTEAPAVKRPYVRKLVVRSPRLPRFTWLLRNGRRRQQSSLLGPTRPRPEIEGTTTQTKPPFRHEKARNLVRRSLACERDNSTHLRLLSRRQLQQDELLARSDITKERDIWVRNTMFVLTVGTEIWSLSEPLRHSIVLEEQAEAAALARLHSTLRPQLDEATARFHIAQDEALSWGLLYASKRELRVGKARARSRRNPVGTMDGALGETVHANKRHRLERDVGIARCSSPARARNDTSLAAASEPVRPAGGAEPQPTRTTRERSATLASPSTTPDDTPAPKPSRKTARAETPPKQPRKVAKTEALPERSRKTPKTRDDVRATTEWTLRDMSDEDIRLRMSTLGLAVNDWIECVWTRSAMGSSPICWRGIILKRSRYAKIRWSHEWRQGHWEDIRGRDGEPEFAEDDLPSHSETFHVKAIERCDTPPPGRDVVEQKRK